MVATTRKLGISFFEYVRGLAKRGSEADRISATGTIPSLAALIRERERE